jgi:hypothetical protein
LEGVDLSKIGLSVAKLNDANLSDATLRGANLEGATLRGANLEGASLVNANLENATFSGAILEDANMAGADLNGAILSQANLGSALLIQANLNEADLSEADLSEADFAEANLSDSALFGANLEDANLFGAIMEDAKLSGANLEDVIVNAANLDEADLDGIYRTYFSDTSSGWLVHKFSETEPWAIEYAAGRLRMYDAPPPSHTWSLNSSAGREIEDARVEVDASVTGNAPENTDVAWGIICRAVDGDNYYTLGIYADGRPSIWKLKENKGTELGTGNPSDAFRGGTATNHLRADCLGSKLTLYVNGRKVLQAEDSEFKSGGLGLFVEDSASEEAIEVSFDNFLVNSP